MKFSSTNRGAHSAILVCLLTVAGCAQEAPAPVNPPPTIPVAVPIERDVTDYSDYTGRAAAIDFVEVRARVGGYLDKIYFKEGTLVKKGDILFEIDPRPTKALVDFATAQLAAAEAQRKKAKADNARNKQLPRKTPGAVSQQELDQSQAAEDNAIAQVETAKATLEVNKLNLSFTKVTSPIDGHTSRFNVTEGNLVVQDQTLLTTVISVNPMYVYFDVDERTVLDVRQMIRKGSAKSARDVVWTVYLRLANEEGFPHEGKVDFVDNQISPRTGTLKLRAVFDNPKEFLSPGLFARVRVPIGFPHKALLISDRAIDTDQGQKIVYVVEKDNKVVVRPIRTGALHDGLRR